MRGEPTSQLGIDVGYDAGWSLVMEHPLSSDLLAFGLATRPDATAVVEGDCSLSFREVDTRAHALAAWLQQKGLVRGDRVVLLAKNEIQYLEIQVACMRAGLILVPVNFRLAGPEVAYILGDCAAGLVIVTPEFASLVADSETLCIDHQYEEIVTSGEKVDQQPIDAAADCTILYTSGTTGRPKGAVLTNHALFARISANLFEYQVKAGDVFLQCLPLFHIASNVTYTYTYGGGTNVLLKDFHPLAVLDLVAGHQVSTALLVPTMINALIHQQETVNADLGSLEKIAYGASPIPPSLLEQAIELLGCNFLQLYGMTETSAATVLRPEHHDPLHQASLLASAGQAALGMETRIVNDQDEEVARGEPGEIACRGDAVMRGYWRQESASAEALRGGWMHTGDVGYQDENGFFYVTDRKKDMIVTGGENVYPREIEDVLFAHPDVLEAAVIGVPDDRWGERVHAVLVAEPDREMDLDDVLTFVRGRVAGYKVPKSAELVDELPKNATGKVQKVLLREKHWRGEDRSVS